MNDHDRVTDPTALTTSQILREVASLKELIDQWQALHEERHVFAAHEAQALRDAWRADAMQWRQNHDHSHSDHKDGHEREHLLNQQAIDKAESSVDKAVGAARDTMEESIRGLSDRISRAEEERRRALALMQDVISTHALSLETVRARAEANAANVRNLQDTLAWSAKLVGGAVFLALLTAILTLVFKPGLI